MKAIFSEFGTPHSIVSDNGPCYAAQYFADAMAEWGVNHIKVSPHHHQANGLAEGYVCIVKQLLTKAKESGHDPHKAISIYRTTPLSDKLPSPFQLLYGRRPQTDQPPCGNSCYVHHSTEQEVVSCSHRGVSRLLILQNPSIR